MGFIVIPAIVVGVAAIIAAVWVIIALSSDDPEDDEMGDYGADGDSE